MVAQIEILKVHVVALVLVFLFVVVPKYVEVRIVTKMCRDDVFRHDQHHSDYGEWVW